ncbi:MAG: hypothetical protein AAFO04_29255 [Cyanobacteria bacterium J06592_8]
MKTISVSNAIATTLSALIGIFLAPNPAQSATFIYQTATIESVYTERPTTINNITYDGIFQNSVFDPFAMRFREFSGFFVVTEGSLGGAMAVQAVQNSPVDRTTLGGSGIAEIEYFSFLQDATSVPDAVSIPPGLSEFNFQFVPASVAGTPTVISQGWFVTSVPEPITLVALGLIPGSLLFSKKK